MTVLKRTTALLLVTAAFSLLSCSDEPSGPASTLPERPQLTPAVDLDTGWIWFDMTEVGAAGGYEVRLQNGGRQELVVANISVDGRDPEQFTVGEVTPASMRLASTETLTVPVAFAPEAAGVAIAWLRFESNAENFPNIGFLMVGPACDPNLPAGTAAIAPLATLHQETASVGEAKPLFPRVFNVGNAPLRVDTFTIVDDADGAFALSHDAPATPLWIAEGKWVLITVMYAPAAAGDHTATLSIASNDVTTPELDIALTGTAE